MAIRSAILLGAEQVVAIDCLPERLGMAEAAGAITINYEEESVIERLNELTDGRGPDNCIDAVGMEAHTSRTAEKDNGRADVRERVCRVGRCRVGYETRQ